MAPGAPRKRAKSQTRAKGGRAAKRMKFAGRKAAGSAANTGMIRVRRTINQYLYTNIAESAYTQFPPSGWTGLQDYQGSGFMFNISQLPGYTDFTTMFSEYRVNSLTYTFLPKYTNYDATGSGIAGTSTNPNSTEPTLFVARDYDGTSAAGSLASIMQLGNVNIIQGVKPFKIRVVPAFFTSVQTNPSGTTVNNAVNKRKWVAFSTGGAGVDFYSLAVGARWPEMLKGGAVGSYPNGPAWDVYVTADISLRRTQ